MDRMSSGDHLPADEELRAYSGAWSNTSPRNMDHSGYFSHPSMSQQNNGDVKVEIGADGADLSSIRPISEEQRITVEVHDVSAHVPVLFGQPSLASRLFSKKKKEKSDVPSTRQVLYNVSASVEPGQVLALMGPSGSGKTTLLSIMGNRAQKMMKIEGDITYNGAPLMKKTKRQVGYVMQDDLLYESLTVYETLYYAAMLRLPSTMTAQEKKDRIDIVISALGLDGCKGTIIGGFFRKGISGGERKRTSVGHELLINPSVLMLDEPTSGLDSTTAMHLMSILRHLAAGGRAIATTIHQPSSRLAAQLDSLLLLSQGHVMYYGRADHAVDYFQRLGYTLPYRVNAADFLLDLASGDVSTPERNGEEGRAFLVSCSEMYLSQHPMSGFDLKNEKDELSKISQAVAAGNYSKPSIGGGGGGATANIKVAQARNLKQLPPIYSGMALNANGSGFEKHKHKQASGAKDGKGMDVFEGERRWGASFPMQIRILFQRSLKTRRFESLSNQDLIQFIIVAILAGLLWLRKAQGDTIVAARNTLGLLFFELMFLSFRTLFVALFTFPNEYKMMLKERASGMYRLSAFYIARTLSDIPMDLALPTVFVLIIYFMGGLRASADAFFGNYGTVLLAMLVAQSIGLLLGASVMNPKTAQTIASVVMLTIVLTGGFFVVDLAPWIGWIKYLSYIYYSLGLLLYIQFDGGNVEMWSCTDPNSATCALTTSANPETDPNCSLISGDNLQTTLALSQDPSSSTDAIRDGLVLLLFLVVLRIAVYYVLRRKTAGL